MSAKELGEFFVRKWLADISAFDNRLIEEGTRYMGNPVFKIEYKWAGFNTNIRVYRHTPLNHEHPVLSLMPEKD